MFMRLYCTEWTCLSSLKTQAFNWKNWNCQIIDIDVLYICHLTFLLTGRRLIKNDNPTKKGNNGYRKELYYLELLAFRFNSFMLNGWCRKVWPFKDSSKPLWKSVMLVKSGTVVIWTNKNLKSHNQTLNTTESNLLVLKTF